MRVALSKRTSTKAERIFAELLKKNHIPFLHRHRIEGREVDFLIGKYAVEIDGHAQSSARNRWLAAHGYFPLHFSNKVIRENLASVEESIIQKFK